MPFTVSQFELPTEPLSVPDARPAIADFVRWMQEFFDAVLLAAQEDEQFRAMFIPHFLEHLEASLEDFHRSEVLWRAVYHIEQSETYEDQIRDHALYGAQLNFKLYNVRYRLDGFLADQRRKLFARLLGAINAFLKSALSTVPGGGAVTELKDAIENAVDEE